MILEPEQLLADAEQATGLRDWGGADFFEDSFRTLYAAMAASLRDEAQLHAQGLRGAEARLRAMAEARLQLVADRRRFPAIADETIQRPIFILGLPRAGSTFLHSLLGQDPANRHPLTWEMTFPSPPPEPAHRDTDPRIARTQQLFDAMGLSRPEVTALHPFGAREPEECHLLMEHMGLGDSLPGLWRMPGFNKVRAGIDLRQGYQMHRKVLQQLQHRLRGERWVLKNPGHIFYLDHLLAVYPDARIVQTHRDPAKVIPSVTALLAAMRRANSDEPIDEARIAQGNLRAFAAGLDSAIEFRRRPGMEAHFHDVQFRDLMADPLQAARALYTRFELPWSDEVQARMQRWLAADQKHAAKSKFTLAQFGLDEAQIDQAFGGYMENHGVARERG